jgi:hypothetical protein
MKRNALAFWLILIALSWTITPYLAAGEHQDAPKTKAQTPAKGSEQVTIHPSPKNIREKAAVFVFIAWLWLSIGILIYILRLKVKEADRMFHYRYYADSENATESPPEPCSKPSEKK